MQHAHIIDREALLRRFVGNQKIADDMLECFRDNMPVLIEELRRHVAGADQAAIMEAVQGIFNLASSSSALAVENSALQIKYAATVGNLVSVRAIMPLLEQQGQEAIAAINAVSHESDRLSGSSGMSALRGIGRVSAHDRHVRGR